jgi:hypothetical protein
MWLSTTLWSQVLGEERRLNEWSRRPPSSISLRMISCEKSSSSSRRTRPRYRRQAHCTASYTLGRSCSKFMGVVGLRSGKDTDSSTSIYGARSTHYGLYRPDAASGSGAPSYKVAVRTRKGRKDVSDAWEWRMSPLSLTLSAFPLRFCTRWFFASVQSLHLTAETTIKAQSIN